MKPNTSQCTDYYIKDRKNGNHSESISHSIGAETHRSYLLSGCMNSSSLMASMLLSHDVMLKKDYPKIAAALNLGLGLSLTNMFNITIAFKGSFEFHDHNGRIVEPVVH